MAVMECLSLALTLLSIVWDREKVMVLKFDLKSWLQIELS